MHTLRALHVGDVDLLLAIDKAATGYPWSRRQFLEGLSGSEFGWGLEVDGVLAGFALFNRVLDEATLLNIAVTPAFRRHGFARLLLRHSLAELGSRGIVRCLLEVRAGNDPAITLYKSVGFTIDGVRRNYYPAAQGREDALLMSLSLNTI